MIRENLRRNHLTFTLNILHAKKEKVYSAYVSKHNSNRGNKLFF